MVSHRSRVFGTVRRWIAGIMIGGSSLAATGCAFLPTTDDIRSATTTVKDTVSGKAKQDRLKKTYAEARILERRKDYASAERLYRELLVAEPKSRDCYHRLGVMSAVQGKYAEAHQHYNAALQCSQPTPDLWRDIGYCHYMQQQLGPAEQAMRAALAIDPQHAAVMNNLASVVGEQGRLEEAYDLFRRANNEADAECNFAVVCANCGDLPNAQIHFSRALSANADLRPAVEGLLQVTQAMERRQDEARAQLAQLAAQGNQAQQPSGVQIAPNGGIVQASAQQPVGSQVSTNQMNAPAAMVSQAGYSQPGGGATGVVQAGGYAQATAANAGGVQPASYNVDPAMANRAAQALAAAPQQRLLEVYRGSNRTPAGSAQIAAASRAASQPAAVPGAPNGAPFNTAPINSGPTNATPLVGPNGGAWNNAMAAGFAPNPGAQPNSPSSAPAPFSFPSSSSPEYLQPSMQARAKQNNASPPSSLGPREHAAPANRPAGLSFPPL